MKHCVGHTLLAVLPLVRPRTSAPVALPQVYTLSSIFARHIQTVVPVVAARGHINSRILRPLLGDDELPVHKHVPHAANERWNWDLLVEANSGLKHSTNKSVVRKGSQTDWCALDRNCFVARLLRTAHGIVQEFQTEHPVSEDCLHRVPVSICDIVWKLQDLAEAVCLGSSRGVPSQRETEPSFIQLQAKK